MKYSIRLSTLDDLPAMSRVHVDTWRSTYSGLVPDSFLDQLSYEQSENRMRAYQAEQQIYSWVAEDEAGQIVGFARGGKERGGQPGFAGELYAIYIRAAYQGCGIGRGLVRAVFSDLGSANLSPAIIWALRDNPACAFYQRLGGQLAGEKTIEIGGKQLVELGFGFSDLSI